MTAGMHTDRGKWSEANVPHKGWTCIDIDDLESPSQICEMCDSVTIRYAHYMQHPDYPDILAVGVVCAEHMEEDYARPKERERGLRTLARRRAGWAARKWKLSQKGNEYLNTEGYNLTIFPRGDGWAVSVKRRETGCSQLGKKTFATKELARAGSLNALVWAKTHL